MRPENDYYSKFKIIHHMDKIHQLRMGRMCIPCQVQVDITNECPHSCQYCYYSVRGGARGEKSGHAFQSFRPTDMIPRDRMLSLIKEIYESGVGAISFNESSGEPSMHPDFFDFLSLTNSLGIDFSVTTNGSMLTDDMIEEMKYAKWVRFSLDASNNTTWKTLHRPTHTKSLSDIISNIRKLVEIRENGAVIGLGFSINPINYNEIVDFVKLGKSINVNNVRISLAYTKYKDYMHQNYWNECVKQFSIAKKLEDDDFKVFIMEERFRDLESRQKGYDYCLYQNFTTTIGADMKMYPCPATRYIPEFEMADISENTFDYAWFVQRKDWLDKFNISMCPQCWFDGINKFAGYLMCRNPKHVNFV